MICMYILHDFTYMYNLKNNINEQTHQKRNRVIDRENKLVLSGGQKSRKMSKIVKGN